MIIEILVIGLAGYVGGSIGCLIYLDHEVTKLKKRVEALEDTD